MNPNLGFKYPVPHCSHKPEVSIGALVVSEMEGLKPAEPGSASQRPKKKRERGSGVRSVEFLVESFVNKADTD